MGSSVLNRYIAFQKERGQCYRLGGVSAKSTCERWLDPDSNKPTVKREFWENWRKSNTNTVLGTFKELPFILLGVMTVL